MCRSPAVASYEAPEWGSEGVLAMVSELASGVAGLARTLATGRPNGVRAGEKLYCRASSGLQVLASCNQLVRTDGS